MGEKTENKCKIWMNLGKKATRGVEKRRAMRGEKYNSQKGGGINKYRFRTKIKTPAAKSTLNSSISTNLL
jgi:hypothetical protein